MSFSITVPKEEYDFLKRKAELFDRFVESGELTKGELAQIKKSLEGPFLSKAEFLKRHPYLS